MGMRLRDCHFYLLSISSTLSHAFRAGYQTLHILKDNGFEYPLPESDFIMQIKKGELHFLDVEPMLTELVNDVELASDQSNLPQEVDRTFWDDFICSEHDSIVRQ